MSLWINVDLNRIIIILIFSTLLREQSALHCFIMILHILIRHMCRIL